MGIGQLPRAAQDLLAAARYVRQDLVTAYWRDVLDRPVEELAGMAAAALAAVREGKVPYVYVGGHDPGPEYLEWLNRELPQVAVKIWAGSGHFPHLAQPRAFRRAPGGHRDW